MTLADKAFSAKKNRNKKISDGNMSEIVIDESEAMEILHQEYKNGKIRNKKI